MKKNYGKCIAYIMGACASWYYGGWYIAFGLSLPWVSWEWLSKGYILYGDGFLFQVNDGWYGIYKADRFFDSPVLQWIMFGLGCSLLWAAINILRNNEEEDEEPGEEESEES